MGHTPVAKSLPTRKDQNIFKVKLQIEVDLCLEPSDCKQAVSGE